ncbi:cell division protein FtsW [Candidatus Methylacidiphilum fumarolicum]|uniref:Probable peptidoglycan glycosyltransferase FtsW n=2 Tax=Candidatus Methylacidiphilum fumarolicum TaxID=591154 RepID=I0JW40_METFB|nr:putative peptidoglycan glycosyltransferase FtsW [Candidatus Methylacidiphilum fumarolicum]MBW6415708.1 putative lipid II flippase FtsW [Candidatus Methylacidiphilum fumarolicum]TFE68746.1 cell division protein FtsW [Candidatus Methylacidiphilum fumarolicum]TFE71909.1 cell division protein FtsW [Candidatus Methylacidiphilum fumarolicum]TFE72468.1 cell division protein FtsW [Candidatus Methylacidiphilum fumarolicum]TFE76630.1 cell division protein FtsW [Candidatus Methylacidiphilum fumarolicu
MQEFDLFHQKTKKINQFSGYLLVAIALTLLSIGIVALFSASGKFVLGKESQISSLMLRQFLWIAIGLFSCLIFSLIDYHKLLQLSNWLLIFGFFLLILCFVPGIGHKVHGSSRWISVGGFNVEPSEFSKIFISLFFARILSDAKKKVLFFVSPFFTAFVTMGLFVSLLIISGDLGSSLLYFMVFVLFLYLGGISLKWILPILGSGILFVLIVALLMPERRSRLLAFLAMDQDKEGKSYQVWQSLIALGSGGISGLGLGNSRQKMFYLPESTTDFIFPIIGEELGLWATLLIVGLYLSFILTAGWISLFAPDKEGLMIGTSLTSLIGIQTLANLGVVTGLLPNKGFPLPFISYGGSNLVFCLMSVGVLLNIHRQRPPEFHIKVEEKGAQRSINL